MKLLLGFLALRKSIRGDFVNVSPGERTGCSDHGEKSGGDDFGVGATGGSSMQRICSGDSAEQLREGFSLTSFPAGRLFFCSIELHELFGWTYNYVTKIIQCYCEWDLPGISLHMPEGCT
jgi:hypothetical protein